MSRTDQWIGLNKAGTEWLKKQKDIHYSENPIGMCAFKHKPIFGKEVIIEDTIYRECVQAAPWSGGPMYFTHIAVIKNGKITSFMFSWKEDKNVIYEYDFENGTFYI